MRIQHNIPALSSYRNYTNNVSALSKNLEKLSSGYKINRAGDDAAGLAISEKMRAQITGLEVAQKNAKDGISLVQTAEGALTEVHDMLNRMYELAEQSANGTYQDEVDREQLQKEVNQLRTEINRIADSSNFNGIKLLDGSMSTRTAGSRTNTVEGLDRIIKTTIGEGEKPYEVAGNKTILDTASENATVAKFEVELDKLKFNGRYVGDGIASAAGSATFAGKLTIAIGDLKLDISGATGSSALKVKWNSTGQITNSDVPSAATLATAILKSAVKAYGSAGSSSAALVTINGVQWKMEASDKSLKFEQINKPETADEARANFDVKVGFEPDASAQTATIRLSGSIDAGTHVTQEGIPEGNANLANTVFQVTEKDIVDGAKITIGETTLTLKVGADSLVDSGTNVVDLSDMDPDKIDLNKALNEISKTFGKSVSVKGKDGKGKVYTFNFEVGVSDGKNGFPVGLTVQRTDDYNKTSHPAVFNTVEKLADIFKIESTETWDKSTGLTLQIGDTAEKFNQLTVSVSDMHADAMGIGSIDISNQAGASDAMKKIKEAINYVSDARGTLGATQNRLDHTINNLSVMQENIQDAESTIRDVDVAKEMMEYTKNNILVQSAQAMLAQANQLPQGVLQLLQ